MDQYMLGGANPSLLVAPVSPFRLANANSPFNRSRLVWVPPGEWTDSFSGKVLVGPVTVNRTEVCASCRCLRVGMTNAVTVFGQNNI